LTDQNPNRSPEEVARREESEGFVAAEDVAASVLHMVSLPAGANVLDMTVIPTRQPLIGRG
jgi:NADP-dependent 3-hydroxy acid dehydrogenase YdfG